MGIVCLSGYFFLRRTLPPLSGTVVIKEGIQENITIKRNRWGVPAIAAASRGDLFYAIGFVHASDRLFQMDMARRMATGRLSEVFGERALELDRQKKDLLIEESITQSLAEAKLEPELELIIRQYCAGVNEYIDHHPLPPEFTLLGYRPSPWTARDVYSIFKNMEFILAESGSELYNYKVTKALGKQRAAQLLNGVHGATIVHSSDKTRAKSHDTPAMLLDHEIQQGEQSIGSNNWVIGPEKSATGSPILANDPHLPNVFPSYFYQIRAQTGDLLLSGNTIPGTPFIVIGRTGAVGWGFTNIGTDVIDYFALNVNPDNRDQYLVDGQWKDFSWIEKKIEIKGQEPVVHRIKMSTFGPVLEQGNLTLARHSVTLYPSTTLQAFYKMNTAQSIDQFISAAGLFSSPAQNIVFADFKGNFGYYPAGKIPIRGKGDGSLPVNVTKSDDSWRGFHPEEEKPWLLNPRRGYVATANNPVLDDGRLPLFRKTWYPSFRADRIEALLQNTEKLSVEDNTDIQTDSFLPAAAFLVSFIKPLTFPSRNGTFVHSKLTNWNGYADKGLAPYLFYRFERHLARRLFADHLKDEDVKSLVSTSWIYRILEYPGSTTGSLPAGCEYWIDDIGTPEIETWGKMVELSLEDTFADYRKASKSGLPVWENVHRMTYTHPLGTAKLLAPFFNRGPYPTAGGKGCVLTASFRSGKGFAVSHNATFRMIVNFADLDKSLLVNASGQCGHLLSPHYDDQIPLYTGLEYRLMERFSPDDTTLVLKPGTS